MNAFGYTKQYLYRRLETGVVDYNWTIGWPFRTVINEAKHANGKIRMSLDYIEDYEFFNTLISRLGETVYTINDEELIDHIDRNKLYEINRGVV